MATPRMRRSDGGGLSSSASHHNNHTLSSSSTHQATKKDNNPIKTDAELNILVHTKLEPIQKHKTFQRWKGKFLDRFAEFLYDRGMPCAQASAEHMQTTFVKLTKQTNKVLQFIEKGDLSNEKKTVKASLAVQEMCNTLEVTRCELEALIPSLKSEEKRLGFTKFHIGSALIQQDFPQYVAMRQIEEDLAKISQSIDDVLDRQQHDCFQHYQKQVVRFCDILADLDMYEIMKKCIQFRIPPDDSESEDPEEIEIHIVNKDSGATITLEMLETDTVAILQDIIATGFDGLTIERQVLTYKGDVLDEDSKNKTLTELGVQHGDTMEVEPYLLPIQVKLWDGSAPPKTYKVDPAKFVADLHRTCASDFHMEPQNQQFYYNDQPLQVDKKLHNYELQENDVLILEPKLITVKAELPDDSTCELQLSPANDSLESIKQKVEQQASFLPTAKQVVQHNGARLVDANHGEQPLVVRDMGIRDGDTLQIDLHRIPVTVECWDGQVWEQKVDPTELLSNFKRQLVDGSGIPAEKQVLLLKEGNILSENDKSVDENGVKKGSVLYLEPTYFTVQVTMPEGTTQSIEIAPSATLHDIKAAIADTCGIESSRQVVKMDDQLLHTDQETAKAMGLRDGSNITVDIFKIPLRVKTWNDEKPIDLMVEPSNTLAEIKKLLEPGSDIVADKQILSKDDIVIDGDDKTAEELGITANDMLYLEPSSFEIQVNTPEGTIELAVAPSDDADAMKQKIEAKTGIQSSRLHLFEDDMAVPGGVPVKILGLQPATVLDARLNKIPFSVETYDGNVVEVEMEPTETIEALMQLLELRTGMQAVHQVLSKDGGIIYDGTASLADESIAPNDVLQLEPKTVKCQIILPNGETGEVELLLDHDGAAIRERIADLTGIPAALQVVAHDGMHIPSEGRTVRDLSLQERSLLDVAIQQIPLSVRIWPGDQPTSHLSVDPTESIASLKNMLEESSNIPPSNQNLSFNDKLLSDNSKSINACGLGAGSVLDLEPIAINVTATVPDGNHHICIPLKATTADIKDIVADASGVAAVRQVVKHDDKMLPQDHTMVRDLAVRDGDVLDVSIHKIPIVVTTWDGKTINLLVEPVQSLLGVKQALQEDTDIACENQRICFDGKELVDDHKTVNEHGIGADSVLHLGPKVVNIKCEMEDGTVYIVPLKPTDQSVDVKDAIEKVTGMAAAKQVVRHHGVTFPEKKSVRDMGIREGSTLKVEVMRVPIRVNLPDGRQVKILFDITEPLTQLKQELEGECGVPAKKQLLSMFGGETFVGDSSPVTLFGIQEDSLLDMEIKDDPIVFVDCKLGTMFALQRDEAIESGATTCNQGNPFEFVEAVTTAAEIEKGKMAKSMLESPSLQVKPQIVVGKVDVEDYDLQEAAAVKNKWGVKLKKTSRDKRGEEIVFVDLKTESVGYLDRKKLTDLGVITPVGAGKEETLAQAEKDQQRYDYFVREIRGIFRISSAR